MDSLELGSTTGHSSMDNFSLTCNIIRALYDEIRDDPVVFTKWGQIVDSLITENSTMAQIKKHMEDFEYYEAFVWTIKAWISKAGSQATFDGLVAELKNVELNSAAEKLNESKLQLRKAAQRLKQFDVKPCQATCNEVKPLPSKWWPEKRDMIVSFVKRRTEIGESLVSHLRQQLMSSERKVAAIIAKKHAIVGMGGIGKTSTAIWYANEYANDYDRIIWIDSEGESLPKSLTELGKDLGITNSVSPEKLQKEIHTKLQESKCLFVFDNAERFDGGKGLLMFLPKNKLHHAIITSRNHDWGNANEYGEIPALELDVFTMQEYNSLLKDHLDASKISSCEEEHLRELGAELGHLPLAVQCAIATINKSSHTVSSYLEGIRVNLNILMQKKINAYERPIAAALELSIEQIEKDPGIDEVCREWCQIILDVASYCEPDPIPVKLFLNLAETCVGPAVISALDQLVVYSILTRRSEHVLSMHRLFQHVTRERSLRLEPKHVVNALSMVFTSIESMDFFCLTHIKRMWILVTGNTQLDDLQRTFSHFPYQVPCRYAPNSNAFLKSALRNMLRLFRVWDLPVFQICLRLIEHSSYDQAMEICCQVEDLLNDPETEFIPFKKELLLHLRITQVEKMMAFTETPGTNESKEIAKCYEFLHKEVTLSGYSGVVDGTRLHYPAPHNQMTIRTAIILNYIRICDLGKASRELKQLITDANIDDIRVVLRFLEREARFQAFCFPELYQRCGPESLMSPSEDVLRERLIRIICTYTKTLKDSNYRFTEYLNLLEFLSPMMENWCKLDGPSVVHLYAWIVKQLLDSTDTPVKQIQPMLCAVEQVWEMLKSVQLVPPRWLTKQVLTLLSTNKMCSLVLVQVGRANQILHLDEITFMLISRVSKISFSFGGFDSAALEMKDLVNAINKCEPVIRESLLHSKLRLEMSLIQLLQTPSERWKLLNAYDRACYIHIHLGQMDKACALWELVAQYLYEAKDSFQIDVLRIGWHTLEVLDEKQETLEKFMAGIVRCLPNALGKSREILCCHDFIQLLIRLIRCRQYVAAKLTVVWYEKNNQADAYWKSDLERLLKKGIRGNAREQCVANLLRKLKELNGSELSDDGVAVEKSNDCSIEGSSSFLSSEIVATRAKTTPSGSRNLGPMRNCEIL